MPAMHVVITGASSGIGAALAREYGRNAGTTLTLLARRRTAMEDLASGLLAKTVVRVHDLSDTTRATAWIDDVEAESGPIDVMINNAGVENTGWAHAANVDEGLGLLNTNLVTPLLITRALLPRMIERRSGTIVNVASVAAFAAMPLQAWYGASKAALAMFSEVLRAEVRQHGVHVVTVYPGPITTPMSEAAYVVYGGKKGVVALLPEGSPDKLARLVRRAAERKRARVVYPAFYELGRILPWLARWLGDRTRIDAHERAALPSKDA
jgi:short-subunit dehydrogenase